MAISNKSNRSAGTAALVALLVAVAVGGSGVWFLKFNKNYRPFSKPKTSVTATITPKASATPKGTVNPDAKEMNEINAELQGTSEGNVDSEFNDVDKDINSL